MATSLLEGLLTIYIFIGIGLIIGKLLGEYRDRVLKLGTRLAIYVLTPVLVFISLVNTEIVLDFRLVAGIILVQVTTSLLLMGITFAFVKRRGTMENPKLGGYLLIAGFPNATVFPLPIILSVFGEAYLTIIFLFSSSALVLRGTLGTYTSIKLGSGSIEGSGEEKASPTENIDVKKTILKVIGFPPTIGIILAVIFLATGTPLPRDALELIKDPLSAMTSCLGSGIIGLILAGLDTSKLKTYKRDLPACMLIRFVIPFIYFMIVSRFMKFSTDDTIIKSILLLEVMGPPAIFNALFAVNFGLKPEFVATMVVILTLCMIILAPLIIVVAPFLF
ncbi:hypothetical protein GF325_17150 [Candidatus Bathyarchaeota archaeon]|nr:hypothetical protein [Candidatus Bathyarchaeota archaeon]